MQEIIANRQLTGGTSYKAVFVSCTAEGIKPQYGYV